MHETWPGLPAPYSAIADRPTPLFAAMSARATEPSRWRRARWLGFLLSMLAFNAYPLSDFVHRHPSVVEWVVVLTIEAVFSALWVRAMWLSLATTAGFRAIAPWLIGLTVIGLGLAVALGGQYKGLLIYVSIAYAVGLPLRWTLPAITAVTLVTAGVQFRNIDDLGLAPPGVPIPPGALLNDLVTGLSLVFFLGLMMWFYRRVMMLLIAQRRARAELARLAVTDERLRFARDLHDLLGHSLSSISLKSQVARRLVEPGSAAATEIGEIERVARQALTEVREAVTGYRKRTLADEFDAARSTLAAAGVDVTVVLVDTKPLPENIESLLGWVVREASTNVLRHSRARNCRFRLGGTEDEVRLEVCDDGVGTGDDPLVTPGNGLAGLDERVRAVSGRFTAGPAPGRGFVVTAALPLVSR